MPTITGNRPIFRIRYKDAEIREVRKGNELQGGLYYITYINKGPKDIVVGREEGQNIPDYVGGYPNLSTEDFYLYIPDNASAVESGEALGESYAYRSHSSGGYDNAGCLIDDGGIFNYIPAITRDFHRDLTLFCKGTQRRYLYDGTYMWDKEGESSEGGGEDEPPEDPDPEDPGGLPSHGWVKSPQQPFTVVGQNGCMKLYSGSQYRVIGAGGANSSYYGVATPNNPPGDNSGANPSYSKLKFSPRVLDIYNTCVLDSIKRNYPTPGRYGCTGWGNYRSEMCGGYRFTNSNPGADYNSSIKPGDLKKTDFKPGCVLSFYGHVAYIEKVAGDTMYISEAADAGYEAINHGSGLGVSIQSISTLLKNKKHGYGGETFAGLLPNKAGPGGSSGGGGTPQPY